MRVTMQRTQREMRYTLDDGTSVVHPSAFTFNGREYAFFGNVFYDLDDDLVDYIFREVA